MHRRCPSCTEKIFALKTMCLPLSEKKKAIRSPYLARALKVLLVLNVSQQHADNVAAVEVEGDALWCGKQCKKSLRQEPKMWSKAVFPHRSELVDNLRRPFRQLLDSALCQQGNTRARGRQRQVGGV